MDIQNKRLTNSKFSMYYGANQNIQEKAKLLRKRETRAEQILWNHLKNKQLLGFKFRRQHPIEHYIADFYCHKAKLVIEVDGSIHNIPEIKERDDGRTFEIEKFEISVLRFKNEDIYNNINFVLNKIEKFLSG